MKKLFRPLVLGGILLLAVGLAPVMDTTPARAATVTDANLKQMLEDLLREHPEIVLDVLRSHSEDVLDIAQDLDDAKKLKIDGTPCFLVNGLMVRGALSEPLFEAAVDIALEAAR